MRVGALFAGYDGLGLGLREVWPDAEPAWFVEFDPAPSKILAHHWPDVPNYGDITTVDWSAVDPVDVLTGGFPCQDLSHAGKRAGLRPGTRSGLWEHMAYAIDRLRPPLVVIENVRGLLSATAASDVEPCPWCVGGAGDGEPALRAFGSVLGDLAELGYDAGWVGLRAADTGAPHGRFRVFVVAHPHGSGWGEHGRTVDVRAEHVAAERPGAVAGSVSVGAQAPQPIALSAEVGTEVAGVGVDGGISDLERGGGHADTVPVLAANLSSPVLLPTPQRHDGDKYCATAEASQNRSERGYQVMLSDVANLNAFGPYAPAIARWEAALGRPAPSPTEPGKDGRPRLSPRFVEWMMGLPGGHVTDPTIGLSRAQQLKALGNGVVPQQAAMALRMLLGLPTLPTLPTPAVNDMGEGKTVDAWDEWTANMRHRHRNSNGHGRSLAIEAMRLGEP